MEAAVHGALSSGRISPFSLHEITSVDINLPHIVSFVLLLEIFFLIFALFLKTDSLCVGFESL